MNSIWLEHPKYPGYRFSPEGNCLSLRQGRNKIRKSVDRGNGYYFFTLFDDGKRTQVLAHRIIAEIYLPKPESGRNVVNHKDGNPANNTMENLEWVTQSENRKHACRILGKGLGIKNGLAKLDEKKVSEIRNLLSENKTHREIAKIFGVTKNTITSINLGLTWNNRKDYR